MERATEVFEQPTNDLSTTVEARFAVTPLIRPLRYYGHFILAWTQAQ